MKLKTLHQFLQRQLANIIISSALVLNTGAESISTGILDQFEDSLIQSKNQITKVQNLDTSNSLISDTSSIANIELTKNQFDSLLFLSSESDTTLFLNNSCALYVYLQENIDFIGDKKIDKVEVLITLKSGEKKTENINIQNFIELYFKNKCQKQKDFFNMTKVDKIKKNLEKQKLTYPSDEMECKLFYKTWLPNPQTPHMCTIIWKIQNGNNQKRNLEKNPEMEISLRAIVNAQIREGSGFAQEISNTEYSLFNKLCNNLNSIDNFCSNYNKSNFWKTIENYTEDESKVKWKCQQIYKKEKLSRSELLDCMKKLESNPSICESNGAISNSSLLPMPNCEEISNGLLVSKLNTNYQDCPAQIGQNGLITTYRILKHFNKVKPEINIQDCRFPTFASIYEIFLESKELNKWPLEICYIDPADKKERCEKYVPGNHDSYTYAQNNVVGNILYNKKLTPNRQKCTLITEEEYKPERLKFRAGCFILNDSNYCQNSKCQLQVMIDGREILKIYTKGEMLFSFDKFKYNNVNPSLIERIETQYQINHSEIQSLTSAVFHLDKVKNGIISGMGCLEDLVPEYFQATYPDQCTAMPFIIDGHLEKDGITQLLTRLSIDEIHSPRLINWSNILNAVSRLAQNSPLKKWSFYGLR